MATGEDDVVAELLLVTFSRRSFSEKIDIIQKKEVQRLRDVRLTRTPKCSNPVGVGVYSRKKRVSPPLNVSL